MRAKTLLLALCFTCLYSSQLIAAETNAQPPEPVAITPNQPPLDVIPSKKEIKPLFGKLLKDIKVSKSSFNPSQKGSVKLSFNIVKSAKVTVRVYDPDHGLIKALAVSEKMPSGNHDVRWDGTDLSGAVVPDEAYFFTVVAEGESGLKEIYDPTMFSGGKEQDITAASIDPYTHAINYIMPEMGRVMIRLGIQSGPLMYQLVDWKPRVKGQITEHWNGKDKDNVVDIYQHPKFKMIISYFTFPGNSVITYGNKKTNYRDYKNAVADQQEEKPERQKSAERLSHHYKLARTVDYSPTLTLKFANVKGTDENGIPVLSGKTLVKVELDEKDKPIFEKHPFEVVFFLNHQFYAEDETGYTPFNWVWNLSSVSEGEHLLTVNLTSFNDQIGVLSRKVKVVKE
jgi:hypothetical protein